MTRSISVEGMAVAAVHGVGHGHGHVLGAPRSLALLAAVVSVLSKEWLYRATAAVGRRMGSAVLIANAQHHRSDALSSVVALVGVGGAMMGMPVLDPLGGMVVALMIGTAGLEVAADSLTQLTDAVDDAMITRISRVIRDTAGVMDHSDLRVRWSGRELLVDASIVTDPTISVSAASDVSERVRWNIRAEVPAVTEALVLAHPHKGPTKVSCPLALKDRRPREEVEADVAAVMDRRFASTVDVEHITLHYLAYQTAVEVAIRVSMRCCLRMVPSDSPLLGAHAPGSRAMFARWTRPW